MDVKLFPLYLKICYLSSKRWLGRTKGNDFLLWNLHNPIRVCLMLSITEWKRKYDTFAVKWNENKDKAGGREAQIPVNRQVVLHVKPSLAYLEGKSGCRSVYIHEQLWCNPHTSHTSVMIQHLKKNTDCAVMSNVYSGCPVPKWVGVFSFVQCWSRWTCLHKFGGMGHLFVFSTSLGPVYTLMS